MSRSKLQGSFEFQSPISRRQFLNRASALGLTAALSPIYLPTSVIAAPKRGGTLRIGLGHGEISDNLDPGLMTNAFTAVVSMTFANHLGELDAGGNLVPELADSWESSDDLKTWHYKLRKGIEFHNGKPLVAEDVIASINHHRQEESKSAVRSQLKPIVEIKADGKLSFVVTLDQGYADFPHLLCEERLPIYPAQDGRIDWSKGIGTGGYRLEKFEPGVRASFTRNPNYWKSGAAHFDRIEILVIHDVAARTNALKTGEIDVMDNPDTKTLDLLAGTKGIRVDEVGGYAHYSIPMRTDRSPFEDNNIRLALKHGLDRKELLNKLFRGHGTIGNDHPISTANRFFAKDLPVRSYDPDKSRYYLKKAGLESLEVTLHTSEAAFPEAVDAAVLYKEHAKKAGITIKVVREAKDGYWKNVWMQKDWCFCYWRGRAIEDQTFSLTYAADASWNDTFWKHERFNQLLKAARAERDETKRYDMYVEMQRIVRDEGGVVIPIFNNYIMALTDKLKHGPLSGAANLDGYKLAERWWFA